MKKKMQAFLAVVMLISISQVKAQINDVTGQLNKLQQLKGFWIAEKAIMRADGKTSTFVYSANFKETAGDHGLIMTESANIPGMGKLSATNLIGVSPYDGKVHWFSVDNIDVAHEHTGEFTGNKNFSMIYKGVQNSKEYVETVTIELPDPNTLVLKVEATLDGKETILITGEFIRKKAK